MVRAIGSCRWNKTGKVQTKIPVVRIDAVERGIIKHSHHLCPTHTFTILIRHRQCPLLLLPWLQLVTEGCPLQFQFLLRTSQFKPLHHSGELSVTYIKDVHFNALAPLFLMLQTKMLHRSVCHTHLLVKQTFFVIYIIYDISICLVRREIEINRTTFCEYFTLRIDEIPLLFICLWTEFLVRTQTGNFRYRQG